MMRVMKVPVPVKGSSICTPSEDSDWPNSVRSTSSTECRMKSTISIGVYTMPNLCAVFGKAFRKNLSYSSVMIFCRASGVFAALARLRTLS